MTTHPNSELLARIQDKAERTVFLLICSHGPLILAAGCVTGTNLLPAMLGWVVLAAVAAMARAQRPNTPATRSLLSVALCILPALFLLELDGHPWQADAHMQFFVALAVATAMMDRQAVIIGAAAIATHHLTLDFFLPSLVYPGGGDLRRVLLHAVIVAFEAGALEWLVSGTMAAIAAASEAVGENARLAAAGRDAERSHLSNAACARRDATLAVAAELETALSAVVDSLMTSSKELIAGADTLTETAMQTWAEAATSKENSESASESVQTVAAATDDIAANIDEITTRVSEAASASDLAFTEAKATHDTVNELADGASKIGHVVQLIGNIASQTNLLALNATIEAARAGEQGKGFAVVASEVKTLAAATASATKEVAAQIANMQQITRRAVETIKAISGSVERASTITSSITGAIEKQRVATRHIASAALQATAGTACVSTAVGTLSTAIRDATETIGMLRVVGMTVAEHGQSLQSEVSNLSQRLRQQAESEWKAEQRLVSCP